MAEIDQYDYELPQELIAQQPLPRRSDARLLVVERRTATLQHCHVRDLSEILRPSDTLVLNDTRVIPARLVGYRTRTGGRWSGLFLSLEAHGIWKVLGHTRGKLQVGETITLQDEALVDRTQLRLLAKLDGGAWAAKPEGPAQGFELLEQVGRVPLPPYIRGGEMMATDRAAYQTVFAERPGAVAAPTAGLHFTEELLRQITNRGVALARVTLHVGLGTFRPIAADRLADHEMHSEWCCVDQQAVDQIEQRRIAGGRTVAVGTTAVRVLETAASGGSVQAWEGETKLFIRPPYTFQAVDAMLTNFHLPKSTLLVLVRTFGGDELIRQAYVEAIQEHYRFYSYGDAMLIL